VLLAVALDGLYALIPSLCLGLGRLVSLELIWAHRGPHGSYLYELAWDGGSEEGPRLPGLIDPDKRRSQVPISRGPARIGRGAVGPRSPCGRGTGGPRLRRATEMGSRLPEPIAGDPSDPYGFPAEIAEFCEWMAIHGYSRHTVKTKRAGLALFARWHRARRHPSRRGDQADA